PEVTDVTALARINPDDGKARSSSFSSWGRIECGRRRADGRGPRDERGPNMVDEKNRIVQVSFCESVRDIMETSSLRARGPRRPGDAGPVRAKLRRRDLTGRFLSQYLRALELCPLNQPVVLAECRWPKGAIDGHP